MSVRTRNLFGLGVIALLVGAMTGCGGDGAKPGQTSAEATEAGAVTPVQAREIAKEAYIYGFALVDSYRVQYSYFVDKQDPGYKGDWNVIHNTARVFTPADRAV